MAITDATLIIDGTTIDLVANNIRLESCSPFIQNQPASLLFTQESGVPISSDPWANKPVQLWINNGTTNSLIFYGIITRRISPQAAQGWVYGYEATGIEYLAHNWPVVSPFDGTGSISFNLAPNATGYDPTYANLNLAQMILMLLEEPTTVAYFRNTGFGKYWQDGTTWKIDQRTRDDLLLDSYLTSLRHNKPVTFSGDDLLTAIRSVLQSAAPNHAAWIQPVSERPYGATTGPYYPYGILRFSNLTTRSTQITLDMALDPAPEIQRSYDNAYPRLIVRGGASIQPMNLSLKAGDISEDFGISPWFSNNTDAKNKWKLSVLYDNTNRTITGSAWCRRPRKTSNPNEVDPTIPDPNNPNVTITNPNYIASIYDANLTSPSYLLIDPDKPTGNMPDYSWANGIWGQNSNNYGGHLYITRKAATNSNYTQTITRDVTDNTALVANGTCYLTLDSDLPFTDYSKFQMTARIWPGLQTWRRYKINAKLIDGTPVAKRVQPAFPAPVPWVNSDGSLSSYTTAGVAIIEYNANGTANNTQSMMIGFQTDRQTEDLIFDRPVVTCFGSQASLQAGGANVTGQPTDIKVLLPVAVGALETTIPADTVLSNGTRVPNYRGTSYTVDGIQRTKVVNNPEWVSDTDTAMMYTWGNSLLDTCCDTVVEGSAVKYGYAPVIGFGSYLKWTDTAWPSGTFDFLTSDIRGCKINWTHGSGPVTILTHYTLTNRREPYGDQSAIVFHPCLYPLPAQQVADYSQVDSIYSMYGKMSESGQDFFALKAPMLDTAALAASGANKATTGERLTVEEVAGSMAEAQKTNAAAYERNAADAANAGNLDGQGQGWSDATHTAFGESQGRYGTAGGDLPDLYGDL